MSVGILYAPILETRASQKVKRCNLASVSAEFHKTNLCDQIPYDNVRVFGTTCQSHTCVVKRQLSNCGFMAIERNNHCRYPRVPCSNCPILVTSTQGKFPGPILTAL